MTGGAEVGHEPGDGVYPFGESRGVEVAVADRAGGVLQAGEQAGDVGPEETERSLRCVGSHVLGETLFDEERNERPGGLAGGDVKHLVSQDRERVVRLDAAERVGIEHHSMPGVAELRVLTRVGERNEAVQVKRRLDHALELFGVLRHEHSGLVRDLVPVRLDQIESALGLRPHLLYSDAI